MDKRLNRFEKILLILMVLALALLPVLSRSQTYAEIDDGIISPEGIINQHPGIMRFHVIGNSDSSEDQELKLAVRNYVLAKVQNRISEEFEKTADTREYITANLPQIEAWAQMVIDEAGFDYKARATVGIRHIPAKNYGELYFPEGNYEALTITLGEGKGQNWWCVVFPPLCLVDSADSQYSEEFNVGDEEKLQLRFKTAELLSGLEENNALPVFSSAETAFEEAVNRLRSEIPSLPQGQE